MKVSFSICIPAYNRAERLRELLDSILTQDYPLIEIVIAEDCSPQRLAIRQVVQDFCIAHPEVKVAYHENSENLGYDGNLRKLVSLATADYCLFCGNDDLLAPGALKAIANLIGHRSDIGVVLRSYATFSEDPRRHLEIFKYFPTSRIFPPGGATIATFYRRSVVITGMVVRREPAQMLATERHDGTLLYQLYLVGNILAKYSGAVCADIIALYRLGGIPDFGNSEKEKAIYTPREQTPESSIQFVKGMLEIAADVESKTGIPVYKDIVVDICRYSYPIFAIQRNKGVVAFCRYVSGVIRLGLWRSVLVFAYVGALLLFGRRMMDKTIIVIKRLYGSTPRLGTIYGGAE